MNDRDTDRWLVSDQGRRWLRRLAADPRDPLRQARTLRAELTGAKVRTLLEQLALRRKAADKFPAAADMFFDAVALQQATDALVAAVKAQRFPAGETVIDVCCGIGGDLLALAADRPVIGVDRHWGRACFARANCKAHAAHAGRPTPDVQTCVADAARLPLPGSHWLHIDPDRRPGGRRTTRPQFASPTLEEVQSLVDRARGAAIKLAPAAIVPDAWLQQAELQWISRSGQCRQLVAWFGPLARHPGQRSVTILRDTVESAFHWTPRPDPVASASDGFLAPIAPEVCRYVFDPDPAVVAARLIDPLAQQHRLERIDARAAYLTGEHRVSCPALTPFEVEAVLPLDRKRLRALLRERGIGRLEIKKRGVDPDPERLRRELKLRGDRAATLLLAPRATRTIAILARRCPAATPRDG